MRDRCVFDFIHDERWMTHFELWIRSNSGSIDSGVCRKGFTIKQSVVRESSSPQIHVPYHFSSIAWKYFCPFIPRNSRVAFSHAATKNFTLHINSNSNPAFTYAKNHFKTPTIIVHINPPIPVRDQSQSSVLYQLIGSPRSPKAHCAPWATTSAWMSRWSFLMRHWNSISGQGYFCVWSNLPSQLSLYSNKELQETRTWASGTIV